MSSRACLGANVSPEDPAQLVLVLGPSRFRVETRHLARSGALRPLHASDVRSAVWPGESGVHRQRGTSEARRFDEKGCHILQTRGRTAFSKNT